MCGRWSTRWTRRRSSSPSLIPRFFELGLMGIEVPERVRRLPGAASSWRCWRSRSWPGWTPRPRSTWTSTIPWSTTPCSAGAPASSRSATSPGSPADLLGAFALSEPGSGSDAFALATRAERAATDWELTGTKFWITNGAEAGLFIVFANTDFAKGYKGITGFLVERDFPGFSVGKKENKLGIRASSTTELILEQCVVPDENVLGPVGQGYKIADRDAERGADRDRRADDRGGDRRLRGRDRLRQGAQAVREGDRRVPGESSSSSPRWPPTWRRHASWCTTPPG